MSKQPNNIERQKIIELINDLSDEQLVELAMYIDYLSYKASQYQEKKERDSSFLLSIAGLGDSEKTNIWEQDEV